MLPTFDNEMAEILDSFLVETREILERLGQDLLALEKGDTGAELLNSVFRAVHTVKGTSSFLGLDQMTELAHSFEDVLNKLRKGDLTVTPGRMDVMLEAYDAMKVLLQKIEVKDSSPADLNPILEKLSTVSGGLASSTPVVVPKPAASEEVPERQEPPPLQASREQEQAEPHATPPAPQTGANPSGSAPAKVVDSTIRVDVGRLDNLMNLVGELVLGRNRLTQIAMQSNQEHEGTPLAKTLADTSSQIDFITTELQMAVMKTRMVPVAKVFNKLPRLIRDLMKETGKDIDLQIVGEETELDKTIIEELNDPLIHIIRNAADHGIESPDVRSEAGKTRRGTVKVSAAHEGNHIVIAIEDDGHGMDPEKLKQKAIEKGLITEAQAREMSKRDAFNLIFGAGFSTAAKVTNVSGRGVGMDVVRTNIAKLKGIVEIESEVGGGSKFIIKLPLTLAIIQALLVSANKEIYCIPLASVLEVVRVRSSDISTINGREVVRLRNSVLPLARIGQVLGTTRDGEHVEWIYIVVVGLAEQRLGIVVESMIGQKEVVIKSLGGYLGSVSGIAGSTILGDGQVIMIIDVAEFMRLCAEHPDSRRKT